MPPTAHGPRRQRPPLGAMQGFLVLGGSWVAFNGVISPLIWVITPLIWVKSPLIWVTTIVILLIAPLITTHEPPSGGFGFLGEFKVRHCPFSRGSGLGIGAEKPGGLGSNGTLFYPRQEGPGSRCFYAL